MGKDAVSISWWSWLFFMNTLRNTIKYQMITPNWYVCSAFVMFYPSTTNHHSMFPWFSPLSDRSPWQTHTTNLKSFGRPPWHKYQFVGCKSRRNSFIGHPKVRANFIRMSTVGWKWVSAARLVCFGGVRIVCIYKSYIDIYKYNLQFCCIWWLLLCSCYFFSGCSCYFCYYWCWFPTRFLGQHLPRKSTLTTSKPLKAKVFGMIHCSLCWMVGDCGLRDSCHERKIRKQK